MIAWLAKWYAKRVQSRTPSKTPEVPIALLANRCVELRGQVTDQSAHDCIAQLLFLSYEAPNRPVTLCIDSLGGSITASIAILRTIDGLSCPLSTHCSGAAGGTAAVILAHGRHGFRTAIPKAYFGFSPTFMNPTQGYVEAELTQFDRLLAEFIAEDTNKHEAEIAALFNAHTELTSAGALELGLIDLISDMPITPQTE